MILNFLQENKKSNLNEEIDINNPTFITPHFKIYELTDRADFENFSMANNESVADHFGFSQDNWEQYVVSGQVKPLVISNSDNQCLAMILVWAGSSYSFTIRQGKSISLPISFESATNADQNSYWQFISEYQATLPLRTILDKYRDFANSTYMNHLNDDADGAYLNNNSLIGVFEEFYLLKDDPTLGYDYKDVTLPHALSPNSINNQNRAFSDLNNSPVWGINWTDDTVEFTAASITVGNIENTSFNFTGNDDLADTIENTFTPEIASLILGDNEAQQARVARRAEAERQRINAQNIQVVTAVLNSVNYVYDEVMDLGEYDEDWESAIEDVKNRYDNLTDEQKELDIAEEAFNKLTEIKNKWLELYNIKKDEEARREAADFVDRFEQQLTNRVLTNDYVYSPKIDGVIGAIGNIYQTVLSDEGKDKLLSDFNFDYNAKINEIIEAQNRAKENYLANRTRTLEDENLVVIDDCVVIKIFNNYASIIASKRLDEPISELYIPEQVNGVKVTRIEKNAFNGNRTIRAIYLPASINYIGPFAFYNSRMKIYIKRDIMDSDTALRKIKLGLNAINSFRNSDEKYPDLGSMKKVLGRRNNFIDRIRAY